jgi:hypothetical protein
MRTKNVWIVAIMLLVGSFSVNLTAQETIEALVKKCESMESVNIRIVRNRDKAKKITESVVQIIIPAQSDQALIDSFVAAFRKDREMANEEIENIEKGKLVRLFYRFDKRTYSLSIQGDGSAKVSIIDQGDKIE